ncbi:MAG: pyrroline-5-carboxylate reductase [Thermoguttaceae bacterium]|nr:pyrroline-5-carboxylate reductase [Thermoguttaceae bacterium]
MDLSQIRLGFIGAGQMASALAEGLLRAGVIAPSQIVASDPDEAARQRFARLTKAEVYPANAGVVEKADVIILAVKPRLVQPVLEELGPRTSDRLIVSLAAGIATRAILSAIGQQARVIRVMPNTAVRVLQGACAYCLAGKASEEDARLVERLLGAVGLCLRVDESLMDAVTALSGSGPAIVYLLLEAMIDAGVLVGLPRPVARTLALQTFRGAVEMTADTNLHPAELAGQVTSPGGTTIAALKILEERGVRGALMAAVERGAQRAAELRAGS